MLDTTKPLLLTSIGECMLEVAPKLDGEARFSYAGDAYNLVHYMALLLGESKARVGFFSAVGSDFESTRLRSAWAVNGVNTDNVLTDMERTVGLYIARNKPDGTKAYTFYRDRSAARRLFSLPSSEAAVQRVIADSGAIAATAVTAAILGEEPSGREKLLELFRTARARGVTTVFDTNYRPALWQHGQEEAKRWIAELISLTDILLPTDEDMAAAFGHTSPRESIDLGRSLGAKIIVLKCGARGAIVADQESELHVPTSVIDTTNADTTAAGDSFSAAFLTALAAGASLAEAAARANRVAGVVLGYPGAIVPAEAYDDVRRAWAPQ